MYSPPNFNKVSTAIADFSVHSQDPKAVVLPLYASSAGNQTIINVMFYDGPTPPPGTFDNFTNIPSLSSDVGTRSYADAILNSGPGGLR